MSFFPFSNCCQVSRHAYDEREVTMTHMTLSCMQHVTSGSTCGESIVVGLIKSLSGCAMREPDGKVRESDIERAMTAAADSAERWNTGSFRFVRKLQDARGNCGHVDLMNSALHNGRYVAVKQMPNEWVAADPGEFHERHPEAQERPWRDIGLMRELGRAKYPYVNELLGIFRDRETTYIVTSYATEGDLFLWCKNGPAPGVEREVMMKPIMLQVFQAVRLLHELCISHRDLSLENILLTKGANGELEAKIIDFAMATLSRKCRQEARGKVVYRAPEMFGLCEYDAFLTDAFALGVVLFALAARDYPWQSTCGSCAWFKLMADRGLRELLTERKLKGGSGQRLAEVFSPKVVDLLEGLLQIQPGRRMCLGEANFATQQVGQVVVSLDPAGSIWDMDWLREDLRALSGREAQELPVQSAQCSSPSSTCASCSSDNPVSTAA